MQIEFMLDELSDEEIKSIVEIFRPSPAFSKISRKTKERLFAMVCIIFVISVSLLLPKQISSFLRVLISVITFLFLFILLYFLLMMLQSNRERRFSKIQISNYGIVTDQGLEFHLDKEKKVFHWSSLYALKLVDSALMILFTPSYSQIFLPRFFRSSNDWLDFVEVVKKRVKKGSPLRDH